MWYIDCTDEIPKRILDFELSYEWICNGFFSVYKTNLEIYFHVNKKIFGEFASLVAVRIFTFEFISFDL